MYTFPLQFRLNGILVNIFSCFLLGFFTVCFPHHIYNCYSSSAARKNKKSSSYWIEANNYVLLAWTALMYYLGLFWTSCAWRWLVHIVTTFLFLYTRKLKKNIILFFAVKLHYKLANDAVLKISNNHLLLCEASSV